MYVIIRWTYEKGADRIAVSRLITLLDFLDINFEEFFKAMKNFKQS